MELKKMPAQGGKAAAVEQRRLRKLCLEQNIWEVHLSHSDYNWRQLLKAMPDRLSQSLIGPGVVSFTFRLLQNVVDHNYIKIDSGEKHVFEPCCANGDRWQLHFHQMGRWMKRRQFLVHLLLMTLSSAPSAVLHSLPSTSSTHLGRSTTSCKSLQMPGHLPAEMKSVKL